MRDQWRKYAVRFDALQVRERLLILLVATLGTALLYEALALQPLEVRKKRMERQLAEARQSQLQEGGTHTVTPHLEGGGR